MILTLTNARTVLLQHPCLIVLSPIYYGGAKKPLRDFFRPRRRKWTVNQPLTVRLTDGSLICIPEGFETDLRSAPRWLWSVVSPVNDALLAYVIHDYLYVHALGSRPDADLEMFRWAEAINQNQTDNLVCYNMVRVFGGSWWRSSQRKIAAGQRPAGKKAFGNSVPAEYI